MLGRGAATTAHGGGDPAAAQHGVPQGTGVGGYPLVNIQKTMENRHFIWENMGKSTISMAIVRFSMDWLKGNFTYETSMKIMENLWFRFSLKPIH